MSDSPAGARPQGSARLARATNVAPTSGRLVGRGSALEDLASRFEQGARIVTLHGAGGIGKTSLALAHSRAHGEKGEGAWFCDLGEARSPDAICAALARTLGIPLSGKLQDENVLQLGHAIAARGRALVVLDNFEQVVRHAEATLGRWASLAPGARFLVTSREVLKIAGEDVLAVAPLSLPGKGAIEGDAVDLFVERARAARPGFVPRDADAPVVAEIVRKLDGIPLAIELAAARMGVLSAAQLLEKLPSRLDLLVTGRRDASSRHQTLRAAIEWSWELLSPVERAALEQASVFSGGFSLEAARAVLALEGAPEIQDVLQGLVEKSLLRAWSPEELPEELRFAMFESIRDFALEKLGPARREAESRHADFFLERGSAWSESVRRRDGAAALAKLALEAENLFSVHERALAAPESPESRERALRAILVLDALLSMQGPFVRLLQGIDAALQRLSGVDPLLVARVLRARGRACYRFGPSRLEAFPDLERALELARLAGDAALEARLQDDLGELKLHEGKYDEGRALLEAALALGRELGDRSCEASALFHLGDLEHILGRNAESRARLETALELCRASEELSLEAGVLSTLGSIHFRSGRREEGLDCYDRALAAFQRLGHRQNEAAMIGNIGMMHAREGDLKGALAHLERTLAIYVETGHQNGEAFARANMAELLLDLGLLEDARGYNEAAFAIKREGGNRRYLSAVHVISGRIALDRGRQDEATSWFEKALAAGRELGERHHEAEALGYLGCALLERGEPGAARARLEEAVAIFRRSDTELLGIDLAFLSVALVSEGRQDEATSSLEEAERLLREHGRDRRAVVTVCRGHLDLALLARALEEHDEAAAGRHRELVRSAIAAARPAAPSPEGSPGDRSADVRLALRLLEKAAGRAGLTVSAPAEARPDVEASRPVSRESEPATLAEAPRASGELRPIVRLEFTGEDEGEKRIVMFNDRREKLSASHHEVLFRLAVHHQAQPGKPCPLPKESGSRRNFQTRLGELRKRSKISRSLKETLETLPPLFHPKEPRFHPGVIVIVTIA